MISKFYDMGCAVMSCSFRGFAWCANAHHHHIPSLRCGGLLGTHPVTLNLLNLTISTNPSIPCHHSVSVRSTGQPSLTKLAPDSERILDAAPAILEKAGLAGVPMISYGRSMGASCAVHVATYKSEVIKAVVLDSGLQTLKDLPMIAPLTQMMGPAAGNMLAMVPEPIGTLDKMAKLTQPVLLIHGSSDEIIPYAHATRALAACSSQWKKLQTVNDAGHNDVHQRCGGQYWEWFTELLGATGPAPPPAPPLAAADVGALSVKELKSAMKQRGIDFSACVEKSEMQALLLNAIGPAEDGAAAAAEAAPNLDNHDGLVPDVD